MPIISVVTKKDACYYLQHYHSTIAQSVACTWVWVSLYTVDPTAIAIRKFSLVKGSGVIFPYHFW